MKRVKLSGEKSKITLATPPVTEPPLVRKSVSGSTNSKRSLDVISEKDDSDARRIQRKSLPNPVGTGANSSMSEFLAPDRVSKIFNDELTEVERARETKRIGMVLTGLNKSQLIQSQQQIDIKTLNNLLKELAQHVNGVTDENWNIFAQTLQYAVSSHNCGSCFSNIEKLIIELLIHRPSCASPLVQMLITKFVRLKTEPGAEEKDLSLSERKCFDISVKLTSKVVEAVGLKRLTRPLLNIMTSCYPFVLKPPLTHFYYVRNLLTFNKLIGHTFTHSIFSVIILKLVQLDTLLPRELLESERVQEIVFPKLEKRRQNAKNCYVVDENEIEDLTEEILQAYSLKTNEGGLSQLPQIATLEICLSNLISYLSSIEESLDFNALLTIFETEILPTFNTSCVQYVFFYVINSKEEYLHAFLNFLWKKFSNVNTPMVLRIQSVAYIAGVLSRSFNVDARTLKRWISRLSTFANEYLDSKTSTKTFHWANINIHTNGPFYAVCQAIFYVFAFRHFEMIYANADKMKQEDKPNFPPRISPSSFIYSLNLQRLITSELNPLKACCQSVAQKFVDIAQAYQISYCKTVLERNNRSSIRNMIYSNMRDVVNNSDVTLENLMGEGFFPFDPMPLPYCKKIFQDHFRIFDNSGFALSMVTSMDSADSAKRSGLEDDDNSNDLDLGDDEVDGKSMLLVL